MRYLNRLLLTMCLLASVAVGVNQVSATETAAYPAAAIEHLLQFVANSGCTFIRNGTDYDAKAAAAHLKKKYLQVQGKIKTPEAFIEHIASKSSISGEPYSVKCEGKQRISTESWLQQELKRYRQ